MSWIRDLSIKRKLTLIILLTSVVVLLLACGALVAYELATFRRSMARDATVLADVLAQTGTAALSFQDPDAARDMLRALQAEPHVVAARLYGKAGEPFADYARPGAAGTADLPDRPGEDGARFGPDRLALFRPVTLDGRRLGTIHLRLDLEEMSGRLRSYAAILAAVLAGAVLVTVGLSAWLQRLISRPLLGLADAARAVADKRDYSVRATQDGRDEIGLLTGAFNQMLAEIEGGHAALQRANASLTDQAAQLAEGARVLGASAGQILSLSSQLASSASENAAAVTQTTTTVEQVRQTAQVSSQKARYLADSARRAAETSAAGRRATEDSIAGMGRIRDQMGSIAASMTRLTEQGQAIGEIIATVDDLAKQSNLLAVNAAIEAAKAGAHGKGFAVVASEVRSLAEQSRAATQQVRSILSDVRKATAGAVMATEQGSRAVEAGERQSSSAGESIQALGSSVAEATAAAAQIAASSQQQLVGMDQVAQAMESIKLAAAQNVDGARQLEAAARDIDALGQRLKDVVGRYTPQGEPDERGRHDPEGR